MEKYQIECGLCNNTGKIAVRRYDPVLCLNRTKFIDCEYCTNLCYSDAYKGKLEQGLIYNDRLKYYEDEIAAIDLASEISNEKKTLGGLKK